MAAIRRRGKYGEPQLKNSCGAQLDYDRLNQDVNESVNMICNMRHPWTLKAVNELFQQLAGLLRAGHFTKDPPSPRVHCYDGPLPVTSPKPSTP
jgi:hypothetical protein